MATIRKRHGKWQVQVRRLGGKSVSRTVLTKREAEAWARQIESQVDRGELPKAPSRTSRQTLSLGDLLVRYMEEITPQKKSAAVERYRIGKIRRHQISHRFAADIRPDDLAAYRDERLKEVSGETVRQDLVLISQVYEVARREWRLPLSDNPVSDVRKPAGARPRTRRVSGQDLDALMLAVQRVRNPLVREVMLFGLASGMRRGEILRMRWRHVDADTRTLTIPETKNGHPRVIPLTKAALEVLQRVRSAGYDADRVYPISANAFRLSWERVRERAGIDDLRFHDFRHEAVSRFFEAGLSLPEVALISGHRDPRQLMRYTHLDAIKIAKKLAAPPAA